MDAIAMIHRAIAVRTAQGLGVEATGIKDRPEPFTRYFTTEADRDAYIARCEARGETCRILGAA